MKTEKNYQSLAKDNLQFTHPLTPSSHKGWGKISLVDIKSRKVAFTKPSRGTNVSERRTIISGNDAFRFNCERCRLMRGAIDSQNKKVAFTLAEVLITLGIIGVVAAVTMPSLIQEHREKTTVTRLSQTYSLLSQAVTRMIEDNGYVQDWGETGTSRVTKFHELLPKYVDVIRKCEKMKRGCLPSTYKYGTFGAPSDVTIAGNTTVSNGYLLKNGVSIRVPLSSSNTCQQDRTLSKKGCSEYNLECDPKSATLRYGTYLHSCFELLVDINGPAGPNKADVDAFRFAVVQDGIVPKGSARETIGIEKFENTCVKYKANCNGRCAAWVIYNKNMDYLHCPNKLGWNKASSCK